MKYIKSVKFYVASLSLVGALVVPVFAAGSVNAIDGPGKSDPVKLSCFNNDEEAVNVERINQDIALPPVTCDLAVNKQVSVNGGAFVDADTSSAAANATVGDTVTWKITVTNTSTEGYLPTYAKIVVSDVLPSATTFVSSAASTGTFAANEWAFNTTDDGTDLSATLTIVSTAAVQGIAQNTAYFSNYAVCIEVCTEYNGYYYDADSSNNSNDAFVNITSKPAVLGITTTVTPPATLANTGSSLVQSLLAGTMIVTTLGVLSYGKLFKKN